MSGSLKVVKIFLASPGDLKSERTIAKGIVDEINDLVAAQLGYHVELIGWEQTVSSFGRAQAIINRELEQCEYFIGMMWARWGTAPDHGGPYTSGFEEEYEQTIRRRETSGRPEISLYFREIGEDQKRDPGPELQKVLRFREKVNEERKVLYETFNNELDFATRVRRCITKYLFRLKAEENSTASEDKSDAREASLLGPEESKKQGVISSSAAEFLRSTIDFFEKHDREDLSSFDVARFRLRSSVIHHSGNDELTLGVHDANVIFANRGQVEFDSVEISELLECGLINCTEESVPLWHWLSAWSGFEDNRLPIHSLFGSSRKRSGVIAAMNLIGQSLDATEDFPRSDFFSDWFGSNSDTQVKQQALIYLSHWGVETDLALIRAVLDRDDYQTRALATEAIVRISLRGSKEKALSALLDIQPDSLKTALVEEIFIPETGLETKSLLASLTHKNSLVRRFASAILRERKLLPPDDAEKLISDPDAYVRSEALHVLMQTGKIFSESEVKGILIRPKPALGLLSNTDDDGEKLFDQYREEQFMLLPREQLAKLGVRSSIYDQVPFFASVKSDLKGRLPQLRSSIEDSFLTHFNDGVDELARLIGPDSETITKTRGLSEWLRKKLTRTALDIICENGSPADLALVRSTLKAGLIAYSNDDLVYLGKCGEWDDIALIIDLLGKEPVSLAMLMSSDLPKFKMSAKTIYLLGKARLTETISLARANTSLLDALIAEMSLKAVSELSDATILDLFAHDSISTRKAIALKCVRALSKRRVGGLLKQYLTKDQRYYNVVFWLDLGISLPRPTALRAATIAAS